jgi:two-component system, NarL family, nitrate/nitrite response regulator NarL
MPNHEPGCHGVVVALRCLIVDDNPDYLDAARDLLRQEDLDVVGVASSAAEALRMVADLRPDVVLVDIYLGADNGFDLARQLAGGDGDAPPAVIMISTYAENDLADAIAESPALGFVPKSELSRAAIHAALGRPEKA